MAEHLSVEDLKQRYIETMRDEMGEFFHHLFQETARLHLKWNEYEALFNAGPVKIANMNLAAPGFFWLAQNALWHDIILHVCRITDNGTKVLSVKRLPRMTQNVRSETILRPSSRSWKTPRSRPELPGTSTSRIWSSRCCAMRGSRPSSLNGTRSLAPLPRSML
jgi:AbiU2